MGYILRHTNIRIQAERAWLDALLSHAPDVRGLIIIAAPHIGSLNESRENIGAQRLREAGFGTLLVSMLTPYEEARDPDVRYDVSLLSHRLQAILTWIDQQPQLSGLPVGLLVIGTAAAAAVRLIVREPGRIAALCIRSGRADLAGADPLRRLRAPTMLQWPSRETELRRPNQQVFALLAEPKTWLEIPLASTSLIEPGALEASSQASRDWFLQHMPPAPPPDSSNESDERNLPDAP